MVNWYWGPARLALGGGKELGFAEKARRAGFEVFEKNVQYVGLLGESVKETRVTGYSRELEAKVSYTSRGERGTLYVTVSGRNATKSLAEKAESLGGKVDLDEGERLFAVFRGLTGERAGDIVYKLFASRGSRVD